MDKKLIVSPINPSEYPTRLPNSQFFRYTPVPNFIKIAFHEAAPWPEFFFENSASKRQNSLSFYLPNSQFFRYTYVPNFIKIAFHEAAPWPEFFSKIRPPNGKIH
jgi:hypothetical protein